MIKGMGLVNAIVDKEKKTPETYKSGKKMVDHIWVSPDLKDDIIGAGYCRYDEVFNSDHRSSFIRLRDEPSLEATGRKGIRILNSKNEKMVEEYIKCLR